VRDHRGKDIQIKKSAMKKLVFLSVAALSVVALSGQRASAWKQFKFGIGANIEGSSGGNSLLWGALKGQQPPAPGYGGGYPGVPPGPYGPGYGGGYPGVPAGPYGPGFGGFGAGVGGGMVGPLGFNIGNETAPPPMSLPRATQSNKVQPVNYSYGQDGYVDGGYYLPVGYDVYQPPFYWPGR
jgi:hypothetical protein